MAQLSQSVYDETNNPPTVGELMVGGKEESEVEK
jgi:hypothetical protein